jgi:hypothetical protein
MRAQDDLDVHLETARPGVGLVARRVRSIEIATASQSTTTSHGGSVNGEQDPEVVPRVQPFLLDNGTSVEPETADISTTDVAAVAEQVAEEVKGLEEIIRQAFHADDDGVYLSRILTRLIFSVQSNDFSDEEDDIRDEDKAISPAAEEELEIEPTATRSEWHRDATDYIHKHWPPELDGKSASNGASQESINGDDKISDDSQTVEKQHSPRDAVEAHIVVSNTSSQYSTRDDTSEKSNKCSQPSTERDSKMVDTDGKPLPFFTKRYFSLKKLPVDVDQLMEKIEKFDFSLTDSQMTLHHTPVSSATLFPSSKASLSFDSTLVGLDEDATEEDSIKQHWLFNAHKTFLEHIDDNTPSQSTESQGTIDPAHFQTEYGSEISSPPPEEDTYPEGGLRAWLVVFGGWCGMFASLGFLGTLGAFQTYFLENQLSGHSPSQVAWIFSTYTFLVFGCGIYIGPLFDVYGPKWLLLPGTVLLALMMFLLPYCKSRLSLGLASNQY